MRGGRREPIHLDVHSGPQDVYNAKSDSENKSYSPLILKIFEKFYVILRNVSFHVSFVTVLPVRRNHYVVYYDINGTRQN